ncbi:MAG: rhodanese-like domain-containing protein [Hyphomicrobiales bacterium]|nr:rhodanese-like domain-containing protein [Rickettsiales bacterium]MCP5361437.1 rhodanese-like domain-containing protein [Hyphomicrobiales bacterium]
MAHSRDVENIDAISAWNILSKDNEALLVDVRTVPEWTFVGVPELRAIGKEPLLLSWRTYPKMDINPDFITALCQQAPNKETSLLFLCRSGARSLEAAKAALSAGYHHCYNILSGFEGDPNADGHRGMLKGWKAENLPWGQG